MVGNYIVRSVKNIIILCAKITLLVLLLLYSAFVFFSFINETIDMFGRYQDIRGLSNYGVTVQAEKIRNNEKKKAVDILELYPSSGNDKVSLYKYTVEGKEFFVKVKGDFVDNSLEIVYDELNPNIVARKIELRRINHFYEDRLNVFANMYMKSFLFVLAYGLVWFLLDILKYSKLIWGECV